MTEKRFILVEYINKGLFIQDNANDETQYFQGSKASLEKVVDLLNSLADENEQLKSEIEKLSYANEDLLSEKRNWQRMSDEYCKLSDENEHIKNTIKEAYETERTHIGKSVLKQLIEAIQ